MNDNAQPQTPSVYSTADTVFAWLSILFGYLLCRAFPVQSHALGGFLLILAMFAATFAILKLKKVKLPAIALAAGISALLISAALILSESPFLVFLAYTYALATYCYCIAAAFGSSLEPGFSDFIFTDYFRALFVLPFRAFADIFSAIGQGKVKIGIKYLGKILLGIAIAAVPTLLILFFLSYDAGFVAILEDMFTLELSDVLSQLYSLMLGILIGMYVFGLFTASSRQLQTGSTEACRDRLKKLQALPMVTVFTAVIPVIFLYVIYFISQWQYYISGFTGVLPENFSYAEYARQGFFELCSVSVINLILVVGIVLFMRRSGKAAAPVLKLLTVVFCLLTLVLISTAVAKLVMYIDFYGLTQKRIYAMWLMTVIALVYIVIAAGQFVPRLKTVATSLTICAVLFVALCLCNVNAIIAGYNVDRYLAGTLETVDLYAMDQLGDSAVPALVQLAQQTEANPEQHDDTLRRDLTELLREKAEAFKNEESSIFSFTLPSHNAQAALKEYGLLE